jgi:hypothetical protein
MTLTPTPPVVGKICEYIDSVFTLQHTTPEDITEVAKLIAEHDAELMLMVNRTASENEVLRAEFIRAWIES